MRPEQINRADTLSVNLDVEMMQCFRRQTGTNRLCGDILIKQIVN